MTTSRTEGAIFLHGTRGCTQHIMDPAVFQEGAGHLRVMHLGHHSPDLSRDLQRRCGIALYNKQ